MTDLFDRAKASAPRPQMTPDRLIFALLCVGELVLSGTAYGQGFAFDCRASLPVAFCAGFGEAITRVLCLAALLAIFLFTRRIAAQAILGALRDSVSRGWSCVHVAGVLLILLPWALQTMLPRPTAPGVMAMLWIGGLLMAVPAAILALWSPRPLAQAIWRDRGIYGGLAIASLLAPELAAIAQKLWTDTPITDATFRSVAWILQMLGEDLQTDIGRHAMALPDFGVLVGRQCSGVEGFVLIGGFTLFYLWLFRDALNWRRAWLILPVALAASWTLNAVRISALMLIGQHVSPTLAIGGFHSHAGWILFLGLALGLAMGAHRIRWFHADVARAASAPRGGFLGDPHTVLILPFIIFMASAAIIPAVTELPAILYPLRIAVVGAVLLVCRPPFDALFGRPDPLALGTGVACGVLWLISAPPAQAADEALQGALGRLPVALYWIWVASRLLGTILIVPIVEEFFFRGYLLRVFPAGPRIMGLVALLGSAILFGLLHDRVLAGTLAGLLFGLVYLRRGRLGDAILCHIAANAVIAVRTLASGDWSLI